MLAQVILPFIFIIAFTVIIFRWRFFHFEGINRRWVCGAFFLKIVAGFALWWVYSHHYNGLEESDSIRYYNDAIIIKQQWTDDREVFKALMFGLENNTPQFEKVYDKLVGWHSGYRYGLTNDCRTIIRLNVVIAFVSFESHHVHWICMAFLAFLGLAALFRAFKHLFQGRMKLLFVACFLLPSVVFWSAGLLKEGPTLLGVGFLVLGLRNWMDNPKQWRNYVMIICSITILVAVKEYVLFSMLPAICFLFIIKILGHKNTIFKFAVTQLLCFVVAQNAQHFFVGGNFLYVLNKKRVDFENTSLIRNANSAVYVPNTESTFDWVVHYPEAFALSYLRPYLWEIKSWMYALFALENACYVLLIALTLFFFAKPKKEHWPLLLFALSFTLVLASVIGNCVPVLGSIVRYRIAALPFLFIICAACINWKRVYSLVTRRTKS